MSPSFLEFCGVSVSLAEEIQVFPFAVGDGIVILEI